MLEANTDRMWFTIGSILIGAALVILAKNSLPVLYEGVFAQLEDYEMPDMTPVVAGENMIPKESQKFQWASNGNNGSLIQKDGWTRIELPTTATEYGADNNVPVKPATTYTSSMVVRTDAEIDYVRISFFWTHPNGGFLDQIGHNRVATTVSKIGNNEYRIVGTGLTKPDQVRMRIPDVFFTFKGGTYAEFGQFKLEEGSKFTR